VIGFERSFLGYSQVVTLLWCQLLEHHADLCKVQAGHLFIEQLGQYINLFSYLSGLVHISIWAKCLVGKRVAHHKGGWPVAQPRFTKRPSARTITSLPSMVYMSTVVDRVLRVTITGVQPGHIYFDIKMTNVTNDGFILHQAKMLFSDKVTAA
jgi:hypothetical protein